MPKVMSSQGARPGMAFFWKGFLCKLTHSFTSGRCSIRNANNRYGVWTECSITITPIRSLTSTITAVHAAFSGCSSRDFQNAKFHTS